MTKIVHVVPAVPPEVDGLGDYCYKLWSHWPTPKPDWHCLAMRLPPEAHALWPEATLSSFTSASPSLSSQLKAADTDWVVLHYVGFGYEPKGVPLWLPAEVRSWKSTRSNPHFIIVFHEIWATPGPLKSSFWLMPFSKRVIAELEHESTRWFTSCQLYYDRLLKNGGSASKGRIAPIPSTIEPIGPVSYDRPWALAEKRKLKIVIFGQAASRFMTLKNHQNLLRQLCEKNLVERITLVGKKPQGQEAQQQFETLQSSIGFAELWDYKYDLQEQEISQVLMDQDVGLLRDPPAVLTKSTVFAALCSHGILPLCADEVKKQSFGIGPSYKGKPYLPSDDSNCDQCIAKLMDFAQIKQVQQNVETLVTTALQWSSLVSIWDQHTGIVSSRG